MPFDIGALEVARPAEQAAALREAELYHRPGRAERQIDPGVAHHRCTQCRAHAVVATKRAREGGVGRRTGEALLVDAVRNEQPRIVVAEHREAQLQACPAPPQAADVGDSRTAGSVNETSKSLIFLPNCHWKRPRLPWPNRLGSSRPRNPPTPVPCPTDAPKLMLPVRFSDTRNTTSISPCSFAGLVSGNGSG